MSIRPIISEVDADNCFGPSHDCLSHSTVQFNRIQSFSC